VNKTLDIEIARLYELSDPLPRVQSWVGEVRYSNAAIIVTLVLYGEAMLSVVRSEFPSATLHIGNSPSRCVSQAASPRASSTTAAAASKGGRAWSKSWGLDAISKDLGAEAAALRDRAKQVCEETQILRKDRRLILHLARVPLSSRAKPAHR